MVKPRGASGARASARQIARLTCFGVGIRNHSDMQSHRVDLKIRLNGVVGLRGLKPAGGGIRRHAIA